MTPFLESAAAPPGTPSAAAGTLAPLSAARSRGEVGLHAGLVLLAALAVAAAALSDQPVAAVAPAVLVAAVWAVWRAPMRVTLYAACFLLLALEGAGDGSGRFRSPLYGAAMFLHSNLNLSLPIKALRFAGIDLIAALLGVVAAARGISGARIDRDGRVPTARPMLLGACLTLAGILAMSSWGVLHGGNTAQIPWQAHQLAFVAVFFFLFAAALPGRADHALLGKLVVGAALVKAAVASYVRWGLHYNKVEVPTATSHQDSILFAAACAILLAQLWEAPSRLAVKRAVLCAPLLLLGMVANNRRLVWVELFAIGTLIWALSPRSILKKRLTTALVALLPLGAVYLGVGWKSHSSIFKPVQTIRSVVDSKSDRSSETRDVENYNLLTTFRQHPLTGLGFGHEYTEFVKMDDIKTIFPQYRYIPHNSILGLWAFGGLFGFFLLFASVTVGVYLAARSYRFARAPADRVAALVCLAVAVTWTLQAYGDMGVVSWHGSVLLGGALAAAAKLAISTGAWRTGAAASEVAFG